MSAIMEYVWKIRGQLKKDATSYDQLFEAIMGHKKQNVGQDQADAAAGATMPMRQERNV